MAQLVPTRPLTQFCYRDFYILSEGLHTSGLLSPLAWLTESVTAMSCGPIKSFANCCLLAVVHVLAPDFQASESGTT